MNTEELKKRKSQLENALLDVNVALNHPEYVNQFKFERNDTIKMSHLKSPLLRDIYLKCVANGSGFDPNLITQHIEHEALDQFNAIVKEKIRGLSISSLMEIRHELELLMLNDRQSHYNIEIEKIDRMLVESVTGIEAAEVKHISSGKKKGKN